MALVLAFLSAENENRQLEDLSLADIGRLPERLLLSVRTKSINENFFKLKITTIVVFVIMIQRFFFILRVSANALNDCYSGIVDSFNFVH